MMGKAAAFTIAALVGWGGVASATTDPPSGDEVARQIEGQAESATSVHTLAIRLVERDGTARERTARLLRKRAAGATSTLFVFDSPPNIAGTALLIVDRDDPAREDDRWLYLPGMRKTRRISAGERGKAFFGTDFTYDQIRNEGRLRTGEYSMVTQGFDTKDGKPCVTVAARPRTREIADELGYASVVACVETTSWMPIELRMLDAGDKVTKTITLDDLRLIDGYWSAFRREARDERSGHVTIVTTTSVEYGVELPDALFSEGALSRGGR